MPESEDEGDRLERINEIQQLALEIDAYLQKQGDLADTLTGICEWWIPKQRIHEERRKVEAAILYLVERGLIAKRPLADGSFLYVSTQQKADEDRDDDLDNSNDLAGG